MADLPTRDDLFRIAEVELLLGNTKLTRASIETPFTDNWALAQAMAAVGDRVIGQLGAVLGTFYIDACQGETLDKRIFDAVLLRRKDAAVSMGSVLFTTSTPAPAQFLIPRATLLSTSDNIQYETIDDLTYPLGATFAQVAVKSVKSGRNILARAGTITSIQSQILGAPTNLFVTNPLACSVGDDEQNDPSYRASYRGFFANARRGTLAAIEAAALQYPGVTTAVATEILDTTGRPAKIVLLGVTDQFTEKYVDYTGVVPPSYEQRSQVLAQAVLRSLDDTRAAGIPVVVYVANVIIQPITLNLAFRSSQTAQVAYNAITQAVNYVNNLRRGDPLLVAEVRKAIYQVPGIYPTGNEVQFPTGDIYPHALEVLRTARTYVQTNVPQGVDGGFAIVAATGPGAVALAR